MILGIDPGSRWWGWALVEGDRGVAGVLDVACGMVLSRLCRLAQDAASVAIERPGGLPPGLVRARPAAAVTASAELAACAWAAGELAGLLSGDGLAVRRVAAGAVREHFFGQANAGDDAVAALVAQRLPRLSLPMGTGGGAAYGKRGGLLASCRCHAFDAVAVALYAAEVAS